MLKKNILIINPFGIGDILFTTPLIRAIKVQIPDSFLGFWCNERARPILENNPYIDKIFFLSRGDLKKVFKKSKLEGISKFLFLLKELKNYRFNLAVDLSLDYKYSLILKFLRVRERIGYNYRNRGRFLTKKIDIEGYEGKHVIEYYLELLKFLDIIPKDRYLELNLKEADKIWAKEFLENFGVKEGDLLIGVIPAGGGSWGREAMFKHWPKERFAELADILIENFNAKIIILGDKLEKEICQRVSDLMHYKSINAFNKSTSLNEFVALIDRCSIIITNDGGPVHISVARKIKTVSIFGPVDEKVYGPYPLSQDHIVIKKDLPCRPCYKKFRVPFCSYNRECLNSISVKEVFEAVVNLLNK